MAPGPRRLLPSLALAAAFLAACGATGAPDGAGAGTAGKDPLPPARVEDRWFVAVRPEAGAEPYAERHRRVRRADGVLVQEVVWGPSFHAVATARHGVMQVAALVLDGRGLWVDALDGEGRPRGTPALEVGAPFAPGTTWNAARDLVGTIVAVESVETPAGTVAGALRVEVRSRTPDRPSIVTWYDGDLRPVRAEIRDAGGRLLEFRAALADGDPTPEQSTAALAWARLHLPD